MKKNTIDDILGVDTKVNKKEITRISFCRELDFEIELEIETADLVAYIRCTLEEDKKLLGVAETVEYEGEDPVSWALASYGWKIENYISECHEKFLWQKFFPVCTAKKVIDGRQVRVEYDCASDVVLLKCDTETRAFKVEDLAESLELYEDFEYEDDDAYAKHFISSLRACLKVKGGLAA